MRIGFDADAINERGTSVALYDYAKGVQEFLGHEAVVFYCPQRSVPDVVDKFAANLTLVPFEDRAELPELSAPHDLDFCYYITDGRRRVLPVTARRSGVHAVFRHFEPHGDVYAYVSSWLSDWMTGGQAPAVPHIVTMPEPEGDMRAELGIPAAAFVAGRYGGFDQFNLPMAKKAVIRALKDRQDLYCVFVNTERFVEHPRALFLPSIVSMTEKARFIATCDVGLNAKKIGESFGLATAEFFMLGRPVFSWAGGMDQNHIEMTPKSEWCYRTGGDLYRLLTSYVANEQDRDTARAAVQAYRPEAVMQVFNEVFLSGRHSAAGLDVSPAFKAARAVQRRYRNLKFRLWKMI
ncbi:glycosyltransferase family 4 protein [Roseibium sediminis]|uniref:glycosyltransferase family 4 protein n=1 Tax=Roseibium sediminis TaxID=1775174 RepID=UPI00123DB8F6|nr:glycosyltransferase family 4 protein [Roseibium sediminis]